LSGIVSAHVVEDVDGHVGPFVGRGEEGEHDLGALVARHFVEDAAQDGVGVPGAGGGCAGVEAVVDEALADAGAFGGRVAEGVGVEEVDYVVDFVAVQVQDAQC
jgi:hypothetical protein